MEAKGKVKLEEQAPTYIPPTSLFTNYAYKANTASYVNSNGSNNINYNNCYVCFNPYCTLPYTRIFQPNHSHVHI